MSGHLYYERILRWQPNGIANGGTIPSDVLIPSLLREVGSEVRHPLARFAISESGAPDALIAARAEARVVLSVARCGVNGLAGAP
jgi:hypothetical protein